MRSLHETRCSTQPQNSPFVFEPPLPFRISRSFGIVALSPTPNSGACLCELPDLPSLPAALKTISYHHALRINALVRARKSIPVEARFSRRPFALRQRLRTLRSIPTAASMFPACVFKAILKSSWTRSVPRSRPRFAFYCVTRCVHSMKPVARPNFRTLHSSSNLHSPPGSLDPSGSKCSARFRTAKLAFASCPIFLRSPQR
jgi:hypothetical protein